MARLLAAVSVMLSPLPDALLAQEAAGGACGACHIELPDERLAEPARLLQDDVHGVAGIACAGCHGGDAVSTDARTAHRGMRTRPARDREPEMCARCHSNAEFMKRYNPDLRIDQLDRYLTSVHGRRLAAGDTAVATCVDCHSNHGILPETDERSSVHPLNVPRLCGSCHADPELMAAYELPTDQLEEYERSVHWRMLSEGGDLSAPVCNDCHGNHGAAPPGYESVGRVCAECHYQIGEYYAASPHDSVFAARGQPACATCHANHDIQEATDHLLGIEEAATCRGSGCHSAADAGGQAAVAIQSLVDSLRTAYMEADSLLLEAEHAGMHVSQAQFELNQARTALVETRAVVHAARLEAVREKVGEGLEIAAEGYAEAEAAFHELDIRRGGLAVSSAVILLLIVGLIMKIRQVERTQAMHAAKTAPGEMDE
jgi:hypothetical protein